MKFTLTYDGDLPASGNKSKPIPASNIRNEFHYQMADLWENHVLLRQLAHVARVPSIQHWIEKTGDEPPPPPWSLPDYREAPEPLQPGQTDLCAPIEVPNVGKFIPLIRNSLHLACAVDILFLRHEEPLNLMKQGGDLDGRLKTLFDALRMPDPKSEYVGADPTADPLYVVLEDDVLISDMSIRSGRLLGNRAKDKHRVRLTMDITVKVLRVFPQNSGLIGG